jgi:hypothetical protein
MARAAFNRKRFLSAMFFSSLRGAFGLEDSSIRLFSKKGRTQEKGKYHSRLEQ